MKILNTLLFCLLPIVGFTQVNWSEFNAKFKEKPKAIMIYFYTDWCGVCKIQEKQIERDVEIQQFLQEEVYFLKINGESKDEITFLDQKFVPSYSDKSHPFVTEFIPPKDVAYPLWIILDENLQILGKFSGLIKKKNFEQLIQQIKKE
ncbi:thioredoxin family protein [Faecalibacter sp. LW9]|uniref:thioredoxin family protein n=1 Tax=Faecalibacter sp. LW9 TaxID=3103144 RepID=UPI002AFF236F|nr:thioredoxin family protein [Faecalibacter sp. LW9]